MSDENEAARASGDQTMIGEAHGVGDHGETHGHDDHAHAEEPLGPVDWPAWAAGIVGAALGIVVAIAFVLATAGV